MKYAEYIRRRGPMNPTLRTDAALARISAQINNACGGHAKPADFMPWANDDNEDASVGDVMSILTGAVKSG